ncbi:putative Ig domain-containing protein [Mesorhizobium sp. CA8]|uniref:putative Ig domain-containing protein n=1 Tax=Mesorhizobium sp. CA8 TaxID=2876637 RepID=UPI001CCB7BEA|nr:putative Ig domain-containing protein [Mesorhizobium sp. CA8]MBZ9759504.1 putative Ig domain-containing protein [Mesorhizobium sp. CA8]
MLLSTGALFGGALSISGSPTLSATEDSPYGSFTARAAGGSPPYTYSLVGSWPAGLSINSSSGFVSGTPTLAGVYSGLSVRVTDHAGTTKDLSTFTITVSEALDTIQSAIPGVFANSDGPRQSALPGSYINEA